MPVPPPHRLAFRQLAGLLRPWRLYAVSSCASTNTLAARYRQQGRLYAPAVVVASRQTAGRGRGSNRFISDQGTLTVTFAYPPTSELPTGLIPLLSGLAVRDSAAELLGGLPVSVQLKWPNDVLVDGRKLAGLLCERVHCVDLIGIGLNVATDPKRLAVLERPLRLHGGAGASMPQAATSLELAGATVTRQQALLTVARHLHTLLAGNEPLSSILRRYDMHHLLVGREVTLALSDSERVTGRCSGIDSLGRLLLQTPSGLRRVLSGQVVSWSSS